MALRFTTQNVSKLCLSLNDDTSSETTVSIVLLFVFFLHGCLDDEIKIN